MPSKHKHDSISNFVCLLALVKASDVISDIHASYYNENKDGSLEISMEVFLRSLRWLKLSECWMISTNLTRRDPGWKLDVHLYVAHVLLPAITLQG